MSQANFPRLKIIEACTQKIANIIHDRDLLIEAVTVALQEFYVAEDKRSFWNKSDSCEDFRLRMELNDAEDWCIRRESRTRKILTFCEKISTETVILSAQEFADFSDCYPDWKDIDNLAE